MKLIDIINEESSNEGLEENLFSKLKKGISNRLKGGSKPGYALYQQFKKGDLDPKKYKKANTDKKEVYNLSSIYDDQDKKTATALKKVSDFKKKTVDNPAAPSEEDKKKLMGNTEYLQIYIDYLNQEKANMKARRDLELAMGYQPSGMDQYEPRMQSYDEKIEDFTKKLNDLKKVREYIRESLRNWFKKEKWVRIDTQGNIAGKCGTMPKGKATQRCLPRAKAQSLTKAQRRATARKKVRGSKKGKQFVRNTKKARVRLKKK